MDRLERVLGYKRFKYWVKNGSLSDDLNPWYDRDLSTYDTPEKRREIVKSEYNVLFRIKGKTLVMLHQNYTLAFMEHEADGVECEMATKIQSFVRGWIARNRFWSPYTDIGVARLNKMFCNL
jgi:hypothetical protein